MTATICTKRIASLHHCTSYNNNNQLLIRSFATQVCPERPRPGPYSGRAPLQRNKLHNQKEDYNPGFLGRGAEIKDAGRRWRGGRYNYFDWPTLKQAIYNCPSAIERDRMPSPWELNYMYRGASIGVRHHGGFAVVAQSLNLTPMRPWVTQLEDFPTWIEDEQIEKRRAQYSNLKSAPSPPHRHQLPPYLKNMYMRVNNIQGKVLSMNDKRRLKLAIYRKINKRFYEEDKQRREELQSQWKEYKQWIRDSKIIEEVEQGFLDETEYKYDMEDSEGNISGLERIKPKESDKKSFTKKYMSGGKQHILLENSTHIATQEEKELKESKEKGFRARMKRFRNRMPSFRREKK